MTHKVIYFKYLFSKLLLLNSLFMILNLYTRKNKYYTTF